MEKKPTLKRTQRITNLPLLNDNESEVELERQGFRNWKFFVNMNGVRWRMRAMTPDDVLRLSHITFVECTRHIFESYEGPYTFDEHLYTSYITIACNYRKRQLLAARSEAETSL